jgi:hypothetical protein
MKIIWIMIAILSFLCGLIAGKNLEQANYHISETKESLVYEGSVYVRAVEGTSIQDYLTAAGKPVEKK